MKLIFAIIQDYDADRVLRSLTSTGFRVTRFAGTGGFLNSSNTTLMIGVEDDSLTSCLSLIRENSERRQESTISDIDVASLGLLRGDIAPVLVGGAVVLVVPIARFERLF